MSKRTTGTYIICTIDIIELLETHAHTFNTVYLNERTITSHVLYFYYLLFSTNNIVYNALIILR